MEESEARGQRDGPGPIPMFLQAGACFGFFDVVAARAHAALLPQDGLALFGLPMALFGIAGGLAASLEALARRMGEKKHSTLTVWMATMVALAPVLLQGARGCVQGCGFTPVQWVLRFLPTCVLVAAVLGMRRLVARDTRRFFFSAIVGTTALSTLAFEQRFDVASVFSPSFVARFTSWSLLGIAASVWLGSRRRSGLAPIAALALVAASAAMTSSAPTATQRTRPAASDQKGSPQANPQPSNILLIVLDSVRADRLPPTRDRRARTPVLDDLARSSYVFSNAIASSNYSLPSHASLLTGLLPSEHGAHPALRGSGRSRVHAPLDPAIPTAAQQLMAAGFSTVGISSNFAFLARWTGLQRGFMTFDDRPKRIFRSSPIAPILLARLAAWLGPPFGPLLLYREAAEIRERLQDELEKERAPFFAFVNLMDAHEPSVPRSPRRFGSLTDARALSYDDGVEYIDRELGELFAWMGARGLLRTTFIVVTSDHGEFLGEGGQWGHAHDGVSSGAIAYREFLGEGGQWGHDVSLSQIMLHVPLLIRPPGGLSATANVDPAFGLHRVLPLINSGIEGFEGLHLPAAEPSLLAEAWSYPDGGPTTGLPDERAVFFGDLKLIAGRGGERRLFDLKKDPLEQHDLWSTLGAPIASQFEAVATEPGRKARKDGASPDAEALERMRSLGYIRPNR